VANPTYIPITATGTFDYWADYTQSPFNLSYAIEFASGTTGSFLLNYTLDDPNTQPNTPNYGWTPIWIPDPINGTAQTASIGGYYQFPIRGLQAIFSALGGTGSVMFAIIQGNPS
jgi:hypothetical protein